MEISGTLLTGVSTINEGLEKSRQAAHAIATDDSNSSVEREAVNLMSAGHQVKAGAFIIKATDQAIGSLLNIVA